MKLLLTLGAANAFLAVALGAFGAHGLKERISAEMLAVYNTGAQYHVYHALALVALAALYSHLPTSAQGMARSAGILFAVGIVFFAGSLYALAITGFTKLGMITPLGGVCFLLGWALLVAAALKIPGR